MEFIRPSFCCLLLLFLVLFSAASTPCLSTGRLLREDASPEVYEIDYKGPETHSSSFPPPNNFHHRRPSIHSGSDRDEPKKTINTKQKVGQIHG